MPITVQVSLLSGCHSTLQAGLHETMERLKQGAHIVLGYSVVPKGRLLDNSGVVLGCHIEIRHSPIRHGDRS